jgi:hypothetical protein
MSTRKPELIEAVWAHGRVMPEADGAQWRVDACGAWMLRQDFGREDSDFGWKLESITPGGEQTVDSLRPFHWRNGYDIANRRPHCRVSADRSNVPAEKRATPPSNREL